MLTLFEKDYISCFNSNNEGHTPQTPWTGTPNNMHLASDNLLGNLSGSDSITKVRYTRD